MKKLIFIGVVLFGLLSCNDLSNTVKINKYYRDSAAQRRDSIVKVLSEFGTMPSAGIEYLNTVKSVIGRDAELYKVKVDSSEYLVVLGYNSVAIVKHK
jgi:hypothetical protein